MPDDARLPAVLSLLLALTIAGVLFARQSSPRTSAAPSTADAAARAHEAAGVVVGGGAAPGFEDRVAAARLAVEAAPDDPDALLALAHLLHDGHRPAEAAELYRRVRNREPGRTEVVFDLADALATAGDLEGAAQVLEARIADAPDDAVALYDLGAVRANGGDPAAARAWLERALEARPEPALRARIEAALDRLGGDAR